jgi:hypothetical protein
MLAPISLLNGHKQKEIRPSKKTEQGLKNIFYPGFSK